MNKSSEGKGIDIVLKKITILLQLNNNDVHQLVLDKKQNLALIGFLKMMTGNKFELTNKIKEIKKL